MGCAAAPVGAPAARIAASCLVSGYKGLPRDYACCKYQRQSCSPTSPMNWRYSPFFTARYTYRNSGPNASLAHSEACSARKVVSQSVGSNSLAWA